MNRFMKKQEFENCMNHVTEIIFILYGRVRNYTEKEIQKKNFSEFWKRICARYMILPEGRGMRYGWCKGSWEGILNLVKWGKTDGINVSLEMGCDASISHMLWHGINRPLKKPLKSGDIVNSR